MKICSQFFYLSRCTDVFNSILYQCADSIWILVFNHVLCFADFVIKYSYFSVHERFRIKFSANWLLLLGISHKHNYIFIRCDFFRNSYFDGVTKVNGGNTLPQMNNSLFFHMKIYERPQENVVFLIHEKHMTLNTQVFASVFFFSFQSYFSFFSIEFHSFSLL